MRSAVIWFVFSALSFVACNEATKNEEITEMRMRKNDSFIPRYCNELLTEVIVYDILSPPVASRVYAYSNLAMYEALRPYRANGHSLLTFFKGFDTLPVPASTSIDFSIAASMAFMKVARTLLFSKDSVAAAEQKIIRAYGKISTEDLESARAWADRVAEVVLKRAASDNYKKTRGMPRYSTFGEQGKWQQTPPEYGDATEPHWRLIRPLLIDSASAFQPTAPPPFDLSQNSAFYREMKEVYQISKNITPAEDSIARFWDDNPFVTEHRGHLTYANKKMTPVGHWMGIIGILCQNTNKDEYSSALAYALGAAAIFDGFISCWEEKYRSERVRPVTVIRALLESEWNPLLQTPPFPEYTSGHSVISSAAAVTMEHIFGKPLAFTDTTERQYLGMIREYSSIMEAADEAGISRLYGGIHFRSAITKGKEQGAAIGQTYCLLFDKLYE
jgi:hypothetical protein